MLGYYTISSFRPLQTRNTEMWTELAFILFYCFPKNGCEYIFIGNGIFFSPVKHK